MTPAKNRIRRFLYISLEYFKENCAYILLNKKDCLQIIIDYKDI